MLAGDWTCTPDDLTESGWLKLVGGVIFAPSSPTCNGKTYDYFVVAQQFSHIVLGCRAICDAGLSPHSPVRLYLQDRATTACVRQARLVVALPAVLPFGPLSRRSSEATLVHDGQSLNDFGMQVVAAIETELYELLAHEHVAGEHSRAFGPSLIWRTLQHQTMPSHVRGKPLVHGWAMVVGWIRTVLTSLKNSVKQSARWRLLYMSAEVNLDDPKEELQQAVLAFKA